LSGDERSSRLRERKLEEDDGCSIEFGYLRLAHRVLDCLSGIGSRIAH